MNNTKEDLFIENKPLKEWWLYLSDIRDRRLESDETFSHEGRIIDAEELYTAKSRDPQCVNSLVQIFNIPVIYEEGGLYFFDDEVYEKVLSYLIEKNIQDSLTETFDTHQSNLTEYGEYFNESIDSFWDLFSNRKDMKWPFQQFKNQMNNLLEENLIVSPDNNIIEEQIKQIQWCIKDFISKLSKEDLLLYTLDDDCKLLASLGFAREYLYAKYYPNKNSDPIMYASFQESYVNYIIDTNTIVWRC